MNKRSLLNLLLAPALLFTTSVSVFAQKKGLATAQEVIGSVSGSSLTTKRTQIINGQNGKVEKRIIENEYQVDQFSRIEIGGKRVEMNDLEVGMLVSVNWDLKSNKERYARMITARVKNEIVVKRPPKPPKKEKEEK